MFDLKDILKNIGAKEKTERKAALVSIAEEEIRWTVSDKTDVLCTINLTKYQLYWLMWRIRVHLKSYENFEWSEMKDVLQSVLTMVEGEWSKCQSTSAQSVGVNIASTKETTVDSVSTMPGGLLMNPQL